MAVNKKICIAELNKKCIIQKRAVVSSVGNYDLSETFTNVYTGFFKIETGIQGTKRFLGVNIDDRSTHLFITRFRQSIKKLDGGGEHFIHYNETRYRILTITNLNEDNRWLLFQCKDRGSDDKKAVDA